MIENGEFNRDELKGANMIANSYAGGEKGRELFPKIISEAKVKKIILMVLEVLEGGRGVLFFDYWG